MTSAKNIRLYYSILFLFALSVFSLKAQEHTVTGNFTDNDGTPIPGVNVVINGTTRGTVTDLEGNYTIQASTGDILVISFIGYKTRYFRVNEFGGTEQITGFDEIRAINLMAYNARKSEKKESDYSTPAVFKTAFPVSDNFTLGLHNPDSGVAVLSDSSQFIINDRWYRSYPAYTPGIQFEKTLIRVRKNKDNLNIYEFDILSDKYVNIPVCKFHSSVAFEKISNLPDRQKDFAQGRIVNNTAQWQGPETGELFSWGPDMNELEYNGLPYVYDKNGYLTNQWEGNGQSANSYNPYEIFQQGVLTNNFLKIDYRTKNINHFLSLKNKTHSGVLPSTKHTRNTLDYGIKYEKRYTKVETDFSYSDAHGNYAENSPVYYYLIRSVFLTPPSFDNSNDIDDAFNTEESYLISTTGLQRSFAEDRIDNPYWILNNSLDKVSEKKIFGRLYFSQKIISNIYTGLNYGYEKYYKAHTSAISRLSNTFPEGVYFYRMGETQLHSVSANVNGKWYLRKHTVSAILSHMIKYEKADIDRITGSAYDLETSYIGQLQAESFRRDRTENFSTLKLAYDYSDIIIFNGGLYNSVYSNLSNSGYSGVTAATAFNIHELFNYIDPISYAKVKASTGSLFQNVPVIQDATQFATLLLDENSINNFFSYPESTYSENVKAEEITDMNLGIEFGLFNNRFIGDISLFRKKTKDAVFQVMEAGEVVPENLADLKTDGVDINLKYRTVPYRSLEFIAEMNLTSARTKVDKLYNGEERILLAGYSFISTNAIEDEPLGVLVGTRYLRDEEGNKIIGSDGFPLVDSLPGIIGNPNPDWILDLNTIFEFRGFSLSCLWEIKKGGEVWNGTRSTMSYYGVSKESGDQRNIRNYIFTGVSENGVENNIPVDFANPLNGNDQNRWIRYGETGVAEDGIEDGSWFRLRKVRLTYNFPQNIVYTLKLRSLRLSVFADDLMLLTKYQGVDPETTFMSQKGASGIDYFNFPSASTYGISIDIEF